MQPEIFREIEVVALNFFPRENLLIAKIQCISFSVNSINFAPFELFLHRFETI